MNQETKTSDFDEMLPGVLVELGGVKVDFSLNYHIATELSKVAFDCFDTWGDESSIELLYQHGEPFLGLVKHWLGDKWNDEMLKSMDQEKTQEIRDAMEAAIVNFTPAHLKYEQLTRCAEVKSQVVNQSEEDKPSSE